MSCVAYGCSNRYAKQRPGIRFHRFPKDERLKKEWVKAIRRKDWYPSKNAYLCSAHFKETDFDRTSTLKVVLKPKTVPSVFKGFPMYLQKALQKSQEADLQAEIVSTKADSGTSASEEMQYSEESALKNSNDVSSCESEDKDSSAEMNGKEISPVTKSSEVKKDTSVKPTILRMISPATPKTAPLSVLSKYGLNKGIVDALSASNCQKPSESSPSPIQIFVSSTKEEKVVETKDSEADKAVEIKELEVKLQRGERLLDQYRKKVKRLHQQNRRSRNRVEVLKRRIKIFENNLTSDEDVSDDDISEDQIYRELLRHQGTSDDDEDDVSELCGGPE